MHRLYNFNNFEKTSANDRNLCFNCLTHDGVSPECNIAGEFYKKVCEEITLFLSRKDNENRIKTSSICNKKYQNKIKNYEYLIDKIYTDLIYLIYFYFNLYCLVSENFDYLIKLHIYKHLIIILGLILPIYDECSFLSKFMMIMEYSPRFL